jgi:hypothetical protein
MLKKLWWAGLLVATLFLYKEAVADGYITFDEPATSGGITDGATVITGGSDGEILFNNDGTVDGAEGVTYDGTSVVITNTGVEDNALSLSKGTQGDWHVRVTTTASSSTNLRIYKDTFLFANLLYNANSGSAETTFYPLGGSARFYPTGDSTGDIRMITGTYSFQGDTDTGVIRFSADALNFRAGGDQARLTTSGLTLGAAATAASRLAVNGNVGIGSSYYTTAAPSNGMIVQGNFGIGTSTVNATLEVLGTVAVGSGKPTVTVDGATTFAVASSYMSLECTDAETINTITGGSTGMTLIIEHLDTDCTIADDDTATASDAVNLNGTGNLAGAAGTNLTLIYTGEHWQELTRSVNN